MTAKSPPSLHRRRVLLVRSRAIRASGVWADVRCRFDIDQLGCDVMAVRFLTPAALLTPRRSAAASGPCVQRVLVAVGVVPSGVRRRPMSRRNRSPAKARPGLPLIFRWRRRPPLSGGQTSDKMAFRRATISACVRTSGRGCRQDKEDRNCGDLLPNFMSLVVARAQKLLAVNPGPLLGPSDHDDNAAPSRVFPMACSMVTFTAPYRCDPHDGRI